MEISSPTRCLTLVADDYQVSTREQASLVLWDRPSSQHSSCIADPEISQEADSSRRYSIMDPEIPSELSNHWQSVLPNTRTNAYTSGRIHRKHTDNDKSESIEFCQCAQKLERLLSYALATEQIMLVDAKASCRSSPSLTALQIRCPSRGCCPIGEPAKVNHDKSFQS